MLVWIIVIGLIYVNNTDAAWKYQKMKKSWTGFNLCQ